MNAAEPVETTALRALWLDPSAALTTAAAQELAQAGWQVQGFQMLDELDSLAADAEAVIVRVRFDTETLQTVQAQLQSLGWQGALVARVDSGALQLAVETAKLGVEHMLASDDWSVSAWRKLARRLVESRTPESAAPRVTETPAPALSPSTAPLPDTTPRIPRSAVFVDPASQHLLALAQRVAQAEVTALLVGPTGAGKEIMARVLHEGSPRAKGPFVALNCAAMPEHLIEDLLFGHEKGAFTGAHREHRGLFEQAQGGTLFLDEIGEMPLHLQTKLLRVLQERELTRLGGQSPLALDVRIVAATNKDLRQAIANREFREDLYYRIATFRLRLLPLAERPGDILPLVTQCLTQHGRAGQRWHLTADAQARLLSYPWPGNVRELENVIRRAIVLCSDGVITLGHLMFDDWLLPGGPGLTAPRATDPFPTVAPSLPAEALNSPYPMPDDCAEPLEACETVSPADLHSAVKHNEHQIIMATLAATRSRAEAAERLGISPRTLRYKLAQLRERGLGLALAD